MGRYPVDPAKRFWEKVDKTGDCWMWTGSKRWSGSWVYGQFILRHRVGEKRIQVQAHRMSLVLSGRDPAGKQVHHICEQTLCVNPDHLELVTQREHEERHGNSWPPEKILVALREAAQELGRSPAAYEFSPPLARAKVRHWRECVERFRAHSWPHYNTVIYNFGTWNKALAAAGLPTRRVGERGSGRST